MIRLNLVDAARVAEELTYTAYTGVLERWCKLIDPLIEEEFGVDAGSYEVFSRATDKTLTFDPSEWPRVVRILDYENIPYTQE